MQTKITCKVPSARSYVFKKAGNFLCSDNRGKLFWGDVASAIQARSPRKLRAHAIRVAKENGQNASEFISGVEKIGRSNAYRTDWSVRPSTMQPTVA